MNKRQKLIQEAFLDNEEAILIKLKTIYKDSMDTVAKKAKELQNQIAELGVMIDAVEDEAEKAVLKSMQQSKIYQKQYQDALKKQISSILDNMQVEEFKSIDEYLRKCYEDGFIGTMYDLHGQDIPLIMPINQESMVRAVQTDSKISQGLYKRLGEDIPTLKRKITAQVSRGIATGMSYQQMAQQLAGISKIGYNNALRIARTEGHRIQVQSGMDACYDAKEAGADVVKQWDSSLDNRTRPSHQRVDGEIRELDEPFSNGLMFPGDPSGGVAEVVNCRCALLQRARAALDEAELETLKERAAFFGLDKNDNFKEFKKKYLKAATTAGIMNLYFKNVKEKKGDEGAAVLESYTSLPDKVRTAFEKVTFEFGYAASACDINNRTIRVGIGADKEAIDHEFGHLIERELMDADEVDAYKRYLVEGLSKKDIIPVTFHDNTGKEIAGLIVKGDRFISEYQGFLYYDDISDLINSDGSINIDCLGEVISEPFRMYCNNEELNDNIIIDMIERVVK